MTRRFTRLLKDTRGASIVEFAIVVPILVSFIYGTYVFGQILEAGAGVQHALGEGARYATIYQNRPVVVTEAEIDNAIKAKINAKLFGAHGGTFSEPTIDNSNLANGYKTITVTYTFTPNFLFFSLPSQTMTRSKTVYIAQ